MPVAACTAYGAYTTQRAFCFYTNGGGMGIRLIWLKNRWRGISAAVVALLALVLVLFMLFDRSGLGVAFLGDAGASRAAASRSSGTVLPRSSDPNAPIDSVPVAASILDRGAPASAGPQD